MIPAESVSSPLCVRQAVIALLYPPRVVHVSRVARAPFLHPVLDLFAPEMQPGSSEG